MYTCIHIIRSTGAHEPRKAARKAARSVQLCTIAQNSCLQHVVFTIDLRDKLSVASSWVCALGIHVAITTMLPQRVFPIVQDFPYTESPKCA